MRVKLFKKKDGKKRTKKYNKYIGKAFVTDGKSFHLK